MLNKTQLIGYIGRINETKIIGGGTKVASFSLATNKKYKGSDGEWNTRTQWHAVQCWGKLADSAEVYIKKGSLVYIEGELDYNEYEQNGNKIKRAVIQCFKFNLLDKNNAENTGLEPATPASPAPTKSSIDEEEIPF